MNRPKRKAAGLEYAPPKPGEPFWIPDDVRSVMDALHWDLVYVEQHPDGSVVVTFAHTMRTSDNQPGAIWEMSLDAVTATASALARSASSARQPPDLWADM